MAINFPDSPVPGQVFQNYVWDGEKWLGASSAAASSVVGAVRYDAAQALTRDQMAQGRANVAVTKKNYVINGGMQVSQENGTTAGAATGYYPVDCWLNGSVTSATFSIAQVASPTPGGSPNRIRLTVSVADASVAAGDLFHITTRLEGLRFADLRFGSTVAKTITIQFGVKAPAGTYCVTLWNATGSRSYVSEYTIAAGEANTDVIKSVVIPGDTTGTWPIDNTAVVDIRFALMAGTTYQQAAGSWGTGNVAGTSNQFNFIGQTAFPFELFDVSLTEGAVAPPFQLPDYASELAACQRYFEKSLGTLYGNSPPAGTNSYIFWCYKTRKRINPTIVFGAGSDYTTANNAACEDWCNAYKTSAIVVIGVGTTASARL